MHHISKTDAELGDKVLVAVAPALEMVENADISSPVSFQQQKVLNGVIEQIQILSPGVAIPKIVREATLGEWINAIIAILMLVDMLRPI